MRHLICTIPIAVLALNPIGATAQHAEVQLNLQEDSESARHLAEFLQDRIPAQINADGQVLSIEQPTDFRIARKDDGSFMVERTQTGRGDSLIGKQSDIDAYLEQWEERRALTLDEVLKEAASKDIEERLGIHSSTSPAAIGSAFQFASEAWKAQFPPTMNVSPECSQAQTSFRTSVEQVSNFRSSTAVASREALIGATRNFDTQCLGAVDRIPQDLKGRIAAILTEDAVAACMAVRIRDNQFLTARHCFFSGDGRDRSPLLNFDTARIAILQAPIETFSIQSVEFPIAPDVVQFKTFEDIIIVNADIPEQQRNYSTIKIVSPRPGARILLPGIFFGHDIERLIPESIFSPELARSRWDKTLRVTKGTDGSDTYCRVFDWSVLKQGFGACLIHGCQSVGGFSGSPIFIRDDDGESWNLAGVQVADANNIRLEQCGPFESGAPLGVVNASGALGAVAPISLNQ